MTWKTHRWRPEQLTSLVERAGLSPVADLRLPPDVRAGPIVVLVARRDR